MALRPCKPSDSSVMIGSPRDMVTTSLEFNLSNTTAVFPNLLVSMYTPLLLNLKNTNLPVLATSAELITLLLTSLSKVILTLSLLNNLVMLPVLVAPV